MLTGSRGAPYEARCLEDVVIFVVIVQKIDYVVDVTTVALGTNLNECTITDI